MKMDKHDLDYKNEIDFQVLSYVTNLNLVDSGQININTSIENDLGITGDDAIDFIEEFSEEFNVDIQLFEYEKYFKPEGNSIFSLFNNTPSKQYDLKIVDLINAVKSGKLE